MSAKVTLLAHTPDPEQTVAMAAKLCYSKSDIETVKEGLTEEKTAAFLDMLSSLGHQSPIEHASFTFGIEGISRACSHQLVRHRIASYSQQSQRYVDGSTFEYVTPPKIAQDPMLLEKYEHALELEAKAYVEIRDSLIAAGIKKYLSENENAAQAFGDISEKTENEIIGDFKEFDKKRFSAFEKTANEDARFILPNACTTKIICTFNARSLMNFFEHRCCNRAQWEIRDVAQQMLLLVKEVCPHIFAKAGPGCLYGGCPEGKMSCGKAKEMREKFGVKS
ncbi:MAG: FAD-dependent thymidylate synthase [Clostridia bacterium]|nr:FAD-dependent thymidylate synthase [Clostridia bacterium]